MTMIELLLFLFIAVVSFILTKIIRQYSLKNKLIDFPNKRSSHSLPTPRGGGVSVILIFFTSLLCFWYIDYIQDYKLIISIIAGGSLIAVIGFMDDHNHIPAKWRFLIHIGATLISLSFLSDLPTITFFAFQINFSIFTILLYMLVLVWMSNLYNFMDGIDGIASVEAISVLLSAALIMYFHDNTSKPYILIILASSVLGFLIMNWPPARIFMGDACSGFLGFTIGLLAISTSSSEGINLWCWLILLSVFIIDATYTLTKRVIIGDKWYEAHRSHAYQILSRRYNSHKIVTLGILTINLLWLLPLAYLASIYQYWAPVISLVAVFPLIVVANLIGAGIRND